MVFALAIGGLLTARASQAQPAEDHPASTQAARYRQLDRFARELPDQQATTVAQLARRLAAAAHSDEEKARLLFAWLAYHVAYDTEYLQGNRSPLRNTA